MFLLMISSLLRAACILKTKSKARKERINTLWPDGSQTSGLISFSVFMRNAAVDAEKVCFSFLEPTFYLQFITPELISLLTAYTHLLRCTKRLLTCRVHLYTAFLWPWFSIHPV